MKMNIGKIAVPFALIIVSTWIARFIWKSELWEVVERLSIGIIGLLISVRTIQAARVSNLEKQSCSRVIDQLSFIIKPDINSNTPYRKFEYVGYVFGIVVLIMIGSELIKLFG